MPATTTAKFNDTTITFTEEGHTYRDDRGRNYQSVTTLLKNYFPVFDAQAAAARMQDQGRGDAAAFIEQWDAKREASCRYGTRVHETAEAALRGLPPPHRPESEKERSAFRAVWDYCVNSILPHGKVIGPELLVFHPHWLIAGTIDLHVRLPNGEVWLLDWKTNATIDRVGFSGRTGLGPLEHLPDCNFSKYALQLCIYQQILINAGYLPRSTVFRRALLWLDPEFKVQFIEVPDLAVEALQCIADQTCGVPF
jgi:hypothetical protein